MRSPLAAVLIVILAILLLEFLLMLSLGKIFALLGSAPPSENLLLFIDPLILAALVSPLLYWLFLRPMRLQQAELLKMISALDRSVMERTLDLLDAKMELERDNEQLKRVEADLRRHEEMLNEAQHLAHLGSWDLDLRANTLVWSVETFRIFELDPACKAVCFETFIARVHPADREFVSRAYAASLQDKTEYDITHRLLFADGRVKWVHERCNTFYDTDGKPLRSIGTTQDITEFKQEKDARTRFATILEETPDVVGITDSAGNTLYLNKAGRRLMGVAENGDIGHLKIADYHPEWELRIVMEQGLPAAVAEGTWTGETALCTGAGQVIPVMQIIMAHKNAEGAVEFYATVMHDITGQKSMEASLRKYNRELEGINHELREAKAQVEQYDKMASIGQLAAGVAHEINNPMGFVFSNLCTLEQYVKEIIELLDMYEHAEESMPHALRAAVRALKQQKELEFIRADLPQLMNESRDGITRVKKIINDLKEFSHVDSFDEWKLADLHAGLDSTLSIVWSEIKFRAEVIKEYGEIPEVECLPSEINQVFINLLINAAQAIESKGVITIRSGIMGGEVFVRIADTGKGIPPEQLKKIFDPFFTTKPVGKGTGLGLSLSFGILQKHGGRIEVQSAPGEGSAFTLWLPVKHRPVIG